MFRPRSGGDRGDYGGVSRVRRLKRFGGPSGSAWVGGRAGQCNGGRGRDIGTVVLPDTDVKIYLTAASAETQAGTAPNQNITNRMAANEAKCSPVVRRRDHLNSTTRCRRLQAAENA